MIGPWVHGMIEFLGRVVEVRYIAKSERWEAKVELVGGVEVRTTETHKTQNDAERAVCDALAALIDQNS